MELRELRYFRAVVESGSFSKAAVKLMVAQPSLSRQIRALEDRLGMALLRRNARGVSPTEAGKVLLERTLRLEEDIDGIQRTFATMAKRVRGILRVAVQAPVSSVLLPELVRSYRARYPDVHLELVEGFSGDVIEKLLAGFIDVAIVDVPSTPFAELNVTPIWVETFSLFGWIDAPAVQPGRTMPVTLAEIAELPLIAPSTRQAVRHLLAAAFERRSLKFRPVLDADGVLMIFELVRAGVGYTVMPTSAFRPYNAHSELRSVEIEPTIRRTISITVRASVAEDPAVSSFREMALELLPELTRTTRFGPVAIYPTARVKH